MSRNAKITVLAGILAVILITSAHALAHTKRSSLDALYVTPNGMPVLQPPRGWNARTVTDTNNEREITFMDAGRNQLQVRVTAKDHNYSLAAHEAAARQVEQMGRATVHDITIAGRPGFTIDTVRAKETASFPLRTKAWEIEGIHYVYVVTAAGNKAVWDKTLLPEFTAAVATLQVK